MKKHVTIMNITVCLVLAVLLCPALMVHAAEPSPEIGDELYRFDILGWKLNVESGYYGPGEFARTHVLEFLGGDIDFVSNYYWYLTPEGKRCAMVCLYAFSDEPFMLSSYKQMGGPSHPEIMYNMLGDYKSVNTYRLDGQSISNTPYMLEVLIGSEYSDNDPYLFDTFEGLPNKRMVEVDGADFNRFDYVKDLVDEYKENGGFPDINPVSYDENMPVLTGVSYESITPIECHEEAYYSECFTLSWDRYEGITKYDYIDVRIAYEYNYATLWSTKRLYGSSFVNVGSLVGLVPVSDFHHDFCIMDIKDYLNIQDEHTPNSIAAHPKKIYLRIVRKTPAGTTYGDWVIYDVDEDVLNNRSIGQGEVFPGDVEFDDMGNVTEPPKSTVAPSASDEDSIDFNELDFSSPVSVLKAFASIIRSLIDALGAIPELFASIFVFLPSYITNSFLLLFIIAIVVGLVKIFT